MMSKKGGNEGWILPKNAYVCKYIYIRLILQQKFMKKQFYFLSDC